MRVSLLLAVVLLLAAASSASAKKSLIELASEGMWKKIVKLARSAPAKELNAANEYKESLLHMACLPHNGQPEAVKALLERKDELTVLDMPDIDGTTALIWAVHNNHYEIVSMMIKAGADVTVKDKSGKGLMGHAATLKMKKTVDPDGDHKDTDSTAYVKRLELGNWDETMEKAEGDVLLYIYAPWCGHCKKFGPVFESLAYDLRTTKMRFAKFDGGSEMPPNDKLNGIVSPGFPAIFILPKGNRLKGVAMFSGNRDDRKQLLKFIMNNSKAKYAFVGGDQEDAEPVDMQAEGSKVDAKPTELDEDGADDPEDDDDPEDFDNAKGEL